MADEMTVERALGVFMPEGSQPPDEYRITVKREDVPELIEAVEDRLELAEHASCEEGCDGCAAWIAMLERLRDAVLALVP